MEAVIVPAISLALWGVWAWLVDHPLGVVERPVKARRAQRNRLDGRGRVIAERIRQSLAKRRAGAGLHGVADDHVQERELHEQRHDEADDKGSGVYEHGGIVS